MTTHTSSSSAEQTLRSFDDLERENRELQLRLQEAEETIHAIQTGTVDAFMVDGEAGQQVYTLAGADRPYRLVIEQMQQGAATLLVDGTIAYCNATLAVLLKVPHQKLIGASFWDFVAAGDVAAFREPLGRNESPVQGEAQLLRSDGEVLHTFLTFNSLPRDCGASIGVLVTDLTMQRLKEQQDRDLRDSMLLQEISAQIIHEENDGTLYARITEAAVTIMQSDFASMQMYHPEPGTPGKLRLLATSGLDEAARKFWEWVTPERGTTCAVALRTGQRFITADIQNCEHVMGTVDHPAFVAAGVNAAQSTPLFSRNGEMLGMLSTHWKEHHTPSERDLRLLDILARQAADLIERRKAEEALRQSKVALTEADRRKDEFLATLAHELRNPLAPIRNGLHIMSRAPSRERVEQLREMMDRQVTHLVRLIDDLLDVSRVSQGKIGLRRQRMTLQGAVQAATEASQPLIDERGHTLAIDLPDRALWLDADLTRVAQIVGNLLNNAAKYTPEGGRIALSAHGEGGHAVLSVTDSGDGIPQDMLPKVFDLFTQVDRNLERAQGGLGIGLALVRQLVEMHGGTIEAASAGAGQGSTFTIRLPLAPVVEDPLASQDDADADAAAAAAPLRVLVVDDNIPAAQTTRWMLESVGHEVKEAANADETLSLARTFHPDVILLDIGLPGMNGYDLCRELRKDPLYKKTLFIAQTGWGQDRDRQLATEAGFDHYLVKPVNFERLSELLMSVSSRPHSD